MPTPSPIIAASSGVKLTTSITCVRTAIRPIAVPRASSAVISGSPAATTVPKVISRMIIAARMPMIVAGPVFGGSTCSIGGPPSWIASAGVRACSAVLITRWIADVGSANDRSSNRTLA